MSSHSDRFTRRGLLLASGTALVAGLAGCRTESNGSTPTDSDGSQSPSGSTDVADDVDGGDGVDGDASGTETDAGTVDTARTETTTATGANGAAQTDTGTTAGRTTTPNLDLREANVTAVEFEESDGSYDFQVTLYHDDDGEDGYADWWQVESLAGEQLGRRELLHAHSTAPFTRSETIDVPAGTTCVVVRGHDQIHGYGGQAMLVNLDTGGAHAVDQGTEREGFDESDCP